MSHKFFHRLRWIFMVAGFIGLTYGVRIIGRWFSGLNVPVFACEMNTDQIVGSFCYYLSHLPSLFAYHEVQEIISFFVSFVVIAVLFGRIFCGFLCPMGFLQDIVWKIREILHIDGMNRKEKFFEVIKTARYLILFLFFGGVIFGLDFCRICPASVTTSAFAGFTQAITVGYLFAVLVLVLGFFMRRFWCNLCPLGFLVGLFHKISLFRLVKDNQACTKCGACYESCPMRIKSIYTESKKTDVTTTDCIFCGECIKKCPENNALAIAIGKKKIYVSSRMDFESCQIKTCRFSRKKKNSEE